jgi:hypothetical protein
VSFPSRDSPPDSGLRPGGDAMAPGARVLSGSARSARPRLPGPVRQNPPEGGPPPHSERGRLEVWQLHVPQSLPGYADPDGSKWRYVLNRNRPAGNSAAHFERRRTVLNAGELRRTKLRSELHGRCGSRSANPCRWPAKYSLLSWDYALGPDDRSIARTTSGQTFRRTDTTKIKQREARYV